MRWTVVWKASAQDDLAELWLTSPDRQAVQAAADSIDRELASNADQKGEYFDPYRLFVMSPLAVAYKVNHDDRLVTVVQVRLSDTLQ